MAPKSFVFVNKHQNSASLTRNTKDEAKLATKVNKHVQKQRFQRDLGVHKAWYRPFVHSNTTTTAVNSPSAEPDFQETSRELRESKNVILPDQRTNISFIATTLAQEPRVTINDWRPVEIEDALSTKDNDPNSYHSHQKLPITTVASRPGDFNDPFNTTAVPLTSTVMELVHGHGKWLEDSSLTGYAVQLGIQRVLSVILFHPIHARAWLAMAATQMMQFRNATFPADHRPELFSFEATKMIREYLHIQRRVVDAHVLMAVFRLAVAEWVRGNAQIARTHFAFVAQHWETCLSKTGPGAHNIEFITSEDVHLAVDVDEKPMFALIWEPLLPVQSCIAFDGSSKSNPACRTFATDQPLDLSLDDEAGDKLLSLLNLTNNQLGNLISLLINDLKSFPNFGRIDFTSAIVGRSWTMRRRMQACLYRLQCLVIDEPSVEACIRRTLIILLLLATTTPARRLGRTNMTQVAIRLKRAVDLFESSNIDLIALADSPQIYTRIRDTGLWFWIYTTGYIAAVEGAANQDLIAWFYRRAYQSASPLWGQFATEYRYNKGLFVQISLLRKCLQGYSTVSPAEFCLESTDRLMNYCASVMLRNEAKVKIDNYVFIENISFGYTVA